MRQICTLACFLFSFCLGVSFAETEHFAPSFPFVKRSPEEVLQNIDDPLLNDYTVRLVGCANEEVRLAGRLEMYYKEQWGTICGHGFTNEAANVACFSLGYKNASAIYLYNTYGGDESKTIILTNVTCTGTETHLDRCSHPHYEDIGVTDCDHSNDIGIACEPVSSSIDVIPGYQAKLTGPEGGFNQSFGRFEIQYNNTWGTACDYRFDADNALVACRTVLARQYNLGFNIRGEIVGIGRDLGGADEDTPIWIGYAECDGTESNIGYCPHTAWGKHTCNHNDDIWLKCEIY